MKKPKQAQVQSVPIRFDIILDEDGKVVFCDLPSDFVKLALELKGILL